MKQSIIFSLLILASFSARAQLVQWAVKPMCDTIYIKNFNLLQGENGKDNILWSLDGKSLFATANQIKPFSSGVAIVQIPNSSSLEGFVDTNGIFKELPHTTSAHGYPYFEDDFLVAMSDGQYILYNKEGKALPLPQLQALYPFSNKFASYFAYQNQYKKKNPFFGFINSDGNAVKNFVIKDNDKMKVIEPKDISFLSAIDHSSGKALAIVKNKLYWFDKSEMALLPILTDDKKKQFELENDKWLKTFEFPADSLTIVAKCGKDKTVEFRFDKLLRLLPDNLSASSSNNATKQYNVPSFPTDLSEIRDGDEYGLILNYKDTIPTQFEKIGVRYGNRALVKTDGRWGALEVLPNCDYAYQLNGGKEIKFGHRTAKTTLRVDLPDNVVSDDVEIEIPGFSGVSIDHRSRESKNTKKENYVAYTCYLDIPAEITDTLSTFSFGPVALRVDGVRLPDRMIKAPSQFLIPYTIEFPEPSAEVSMGKAVFNVVINNNDSIDNAYQYDVSLQSESLSGMAEKVSDNAYMCTVENLTPGINDINLTVTEKACPTSIFPIKINYSKVGKKETASVRLQTLEDILNTPIKYVFDDGYIAAEVLANDAPLHKGPGFNYPRSTYYDEYMGRTEITAPFKGNRIKVKEEGEWYLIYEDLKKFDPSKRDRCYIPKKYIKPLESSPIYIDENANPALYVKVNVEKDDIGYTDYFPEVVAIYPGGLFVAYLADFYEDVFYMGSFSNGDPAFLVDYRFTPVFNRDVESSQLRADRGLAGAGIHMDIPVKDMKYTTYRKHKVEYPDLTIFTEKQWRGVLQDAKAKEYYNEMGWDEVSPDEQLLILTKDELEKKFTKEK